MLDTRLVQTDPIRGDVPANVDRLREAIDRADGDGVDLLVFPELALTGYHLSAVEFRERREAIESGLTRLADVADDVTVVVGSPTYDPLRNSAVVLAGGERVGNYHKTHLYAAEAGVFEAGDAIEPIETPVGTLGVEICYDLEFPEVARELALGGADLLVTVSANMRPFSAYQDAYLRVRAMENAVPHLLCNRVGREDGTDFFGGSAAVDVHGDPLGSAEEDSATEVTVSVDPDARQAETLSYLADRRPALYRRAGESRTITR